MGIVRKSQESGLSIADARKAKAVGDKIHLALDRRRTVAVKLPVRNGDGETLILPAPAAHLVAELLSSLAATGAANLPEAELSTQEAAGILNVSRPYVVKLIDEGRLPSRKVGRFRRIRKSDLDSFKMKDDADRRRIADRLTAEAQELGPGY